MDNFKTSTVELSTFMVVCVRVSIFRFSRCIIEIQYRLKSKFAFNLCVLHEMLRNVNSQTNVKIDINCVIDFKIFARTH